MSELYPPTFADFYLLDMPTIADPYPMYQRLRTANAVGFDHDLGLLVAYGYAPVSAALRDARFSAARMPDGSQFPPELQALRSTFEFVSHQMLFRDPPDHTRLRGLVSKAFTPRMIETLRASITTLVDDLLAKATAQGEMDAIADFAYPLPTNVIMGMLGIPSTDREDFKRWSDDFAAFLGTTDEAATQRLMNSVGEVSDYLRHLIKGRTGNEEDLLSALLVAEEHGDMLHETELFANVVLLLAAGHETTTNLIGNGLYLLLTHPEQMARLRADATLMPLAVEEFLRYESPVQYTSRLATTEMELGGQPIAAGQEVVLSIAAANRDPAQFSDPERLDVGRRDNRHLAFAFGNHFCLGAPLARLEAQIAFTALLSRFPVLHLREAHPPYLRNAAFHGLQRLPIGMA
ncbi:MAG: cytochrome P450 [Ktedonobacterales bacterium]|nr:cytochrome P450 [Ktedonobacterales bacterium]